jgi:hypothetical protein
MPEEEEIPEMINDIFDGFDVKMSILEIFDGNFKVCVN